MKHRAAIHHLGEGSVPTWEVEAEFGADAVPELVAAGLVIVSSLRVKLSLKGRALLTELRYEAQRRGERI